MNATLMHVRTNPRGVVGRRTFLHTLGAGAASSACSAGRTP